MRCGLAKTITAPHLIFAVTCVVWCSLEFSQNHNCIISHFCGHMCIAVYKMRFEEGIFFKFWVFRIQPKTNFSLCFGSSLNYWAIFSLFWADFPSQHLLGLSNYIYIYIYLKTRVIKPLIIYLILKINILIYREGAVWYSFLITKPQTALHHTVWCIITCGAVHYYLWCNAVMPFCRLFGVVYAICAVWWTPYI